LLGQILMASTYPLEVVEAARWLQTPANAALRGDQLAAALALQPWDPSVKALVEFPQVLRMLDSRLAWTEQLGDAFLAQQADVMDAVQRLRQRAQAAGTLAQLPHEQVATEGPDIIIEPAEPQVVYVPIYDPNTVYGAWPYPAYPPLYFPPPPNYVVVSGIAFGIGVGVFRPLWDWDRCDWRHHRLIVDRDRFDRFDRDHGGRPDHLHAAVWEHDPAHRRGVPYRNPALHAQFQGREARHDSRGLAQTAQPNAAAARPRVAEAPRPEVLRGGHAQPLPQSQHAALVPSQNSSQMRSPARLPPAPVTRPQAAVQPRSAAPVQPRFAATRGALAFDPSARNAEIRAQAAHRQASRAMIAAPAAAPHAAVSAPRLSAQAPHPAAPSGGHGGDEKHH
jgi:hypothetical protein